MVKSRGMQACNDHDHDNDNEIASFVFVNRKLSTLTITIDSHLRRILHSSANSISVLYPPLWLFGLQPCLTTNVICMIYPLNLCLICPAPKGRGRSDRKNGTGNANSKKGLAGLHPSINLSTRGFTHLSRSPIRRNLLLPQTDSKQSRARRLH